MLALIVAMDKNGVIGSKNAMPWHLPRDLQHFKEITTGHTIIMGRKTFESIGRPLPNRKNIVLTSKEIGFPKEVEVIHDLETIFQWNEQHPQETFFIIGGGELYKQMISHVDRMYITVINESFSGDTYFPQIVKDEWTLVQEEKGPKDKQNPYNYSFLQYNRRG